MTIKIDVIQVGQFVPQQLSRPLACSDRKSRATVSSIARSPAGVVGLTCAHALRGLDGNIFSPDVVGMWSSQANAYLPVGHSSLVVYAPGLGIRGDYGFSDVGFFTLEPSVADQLAQGSELMPLWSRPPAPPSLNGDSVHGVLEAQIHAVDAEMFGGYCDVVVRVDGEGTFAGDSGLMWRATGTREAVGIHAWGSEASPGHGSRFSACMLASRAARQLNVQLLDPR